MFFLLKNHPRPSVPGPRLNITAENDCRRLHCSLRDLSSLLQAVGRLAEYFTGDVFAARFSDALTVVERWVGSPSMELSSPACMRAAVARQLCPAQVTRGSAAHGGVEQSPPFSGLHSGPGKMEWTSYPVGLL